MYVDKGNCFFQEWSDCSKRIMNAALEKSIKKKEKEQFYDIFKSRKGMFIKNKYKICWLKFVYLESPWYGINVLKAMFYLMPVKIKNYSMPISQKLEEIIRFSEYGDNIVEEVREIAAKENKLYPMIFVALMNETPFRFYVSLFDVVYSFESFNSALDLLFKSFFVWNLEYPTNTKSVYMFLQHFVYMIYLPRDKIIGSVCRLIESLDKSKLPSANRN